MSEVPDEFGMIQNLSNVAIYGRYRVPVSDKKSSGSTRIRSTSLLSVNFRGEVDSRVKTTRKAWRLADDDLKRVRRQ